MEPLLYLAHRLPYPPNKGDKVRSFNLLRHLSKRYRVHLGCFVDYAEDMQHVPALAQWCASSHVERIHPTLSKVASLRGLLTGEALTLPYYRNSAMRRWVTEVLARERISRIVVFSSAMAQYLPDPPPRSSVVDFCDVDSYKWTEYGRSRSGPMSWLYRREGEKLLAFERSVSASTEASVFVSVAETDLFRTLAPEAGGRCVAISNGVDAQHFAPSQTRPNPFSGGRQALVFTGAMDYLPNVDAVTNFVAEVWPALSERYPSLDFWIVGMNPVPTVCELAGEKVFVTGTVPDVRPFLQHAAAVVAPLRIARGIQNKVLEAMAMKRPVVCSPQAAEGISAQDGSEWLVATDRDDMLRKIGGLINSPAHAEALGEAARERILLDYSWDAHLSEFDRLIEGESVRPMLTK